MNYSNNKPWHLFKTTLICATVLPLLNSPAAYSRPSLSDLESRVQQLEALVSQQQGQINQAQSDADQAQSNAATNADAITALQADTHNHPDAKLIFLSSTTHQGNLGGLAGADAICQSLAVTAGLSGTFKAWLSAGESMRTRFSTRDAPYKTRRGTTIAHSFVDLLVFDTIHPVLETEQGVVLAPSRAAPDLGEPRANRTAWTGLARNGVAASVDFANCAGWTSNALNQRGHVGTPRWRKLGEDLSTGEDVRPGWLSLGLGNDEFDSCIIPRHLYCVED